METFKKGEKIGKYVINSFIKKGAVAESYTVLGPVFQGTVLLF